MDPETLKSLLKSIDSSNELIEVVKGLRDEIAKQNDVINKQLTDKAELIDLMKARETQFQKEIGEVRGRFEAIIKAHNHLVHCVSQVLGKSTIDIARQAANMTEKNVTSFERDSKLRDGTAYSKSLADAFGDAVSKQRSPS